MYAWRDWYKALCVLIVLVAFVEHPDFPKSLMGVQGLNPWNVLLLFVFMAWLGNKHRERLVWDMPSHINWLLFLYFMVIVFAFFRSMGSIDGLRDYEQLTGGGQSSFAGLFSEQIVNCLKWVIPGLLLFHGCNTENRLRIALIAVSTLYVLLAIQVIKWMPISSIGGGDDLAARSIKILSKEVGYHRVNMSMMLAGASWAAFSLRDMLSSSREKKLLLLAVATLLFGQVLTGGRMGYVTWVLLGLIFGALRWRKLLIGVPVALVMVVLFLPAAKERMLQGFSEDSVSNSSRTHSTEITGDGADVYTVTAGRTFAWGFVVDEIQKSPVIGYGRQAMITTGIASYLWVEYAETFPHPHNAYLEFLLDNGVFGLLVVLPFYFLVVRYSFRLFRNSASPNCTAVGGYCLALVLALLIAGLGSQSFYPREGAVGMWCAIGLMLRVHVQYLRSRRNTVIAHTSNQLTNIWSQSDGGKGAASV